MLIIPICKIDATRIDCESPFDEVTIPGSTITSPNYPNNYDNSENCQLMIRFATNAIVSLTFEEFNTESCCDYLYLHEGSSISSPMIGSKLSGTSPARTKINSTGNTINLRFYSDGSVTRTGFKIYADAIIGNWAA